MNKYLFSIIILVLLALSESRLIASASEGQEELSASASVSVRKTRNHTLGPTLDDVPRIFTLELLMQKPFRKVKMGIKPPQFKNLNQHYILDNRDSQNKDYEEKAATYLRERRDKVNEWRTQQNEIKELRPYTPESLERGELDTQKGARRTAFALNWMKAQNLELIISINRIQNILRLLQREHDVKNQIIEYYKEVKRNNQSKSRFNLFAWYDYGTNYGFSEKLCLALSTIYEFKFRPSFIDDQSRAAHKKREAFVSAIPQSYTPKTLPKRSQGSQEVCPQSTMVSDGNASRAEYEKFLQHEQEIDPDFFLTMQKYNEYQILIKKEQQTNSNFTMNYKDYRAYCESIKMLPDLQINPQEYMDYIAVQRKMGIALSYQDYLDKMQLRKELKSHFQVRIQSPDHALEFASLKRKLLDLLEEYQGNHINHKNGILGQYLELHQKIADLDKKLSRYNLIKFSLYQHKDKAPKTTPLEKTENLLVTGQFPLKRPYYVVSDDFKDWHEVNDVAALDLIPIDIRLEAAEKERIKRQEKKKSGDEFPKKIVTLPEEIILKTKEFIRQAYLKFNSKVFFLGLCGDQMEFLHKFLQEEKKDSLSHMIKGFIPVKIGGRDWILSLPSITGINLGAVDSEQPPALPLLVQHADKMITGRISKRVESYQETLKKHQDAATEIEEQINTSKATIKTLRDAQSLAIKTLMLGLSSDGADSSSTSGTTSQVEKDLKSLQESLNTENDSNLALENEQLDVVHSLNKIFNPEVSNAYELYEEEEDLPLLKPIGKREENSSLSQQIGKEAEKLQRLLKQRKQTDGQEKAKLELATGLLENVSSVVTHIQQIEEKQKVRAKLQPEFRDTKWVLSFYTCLQAMPWQQQQRIKVSFQSTQDANQVEKTELRILHLMQIAYQALFTDRFETQPTKDASINLRKLSESEIGMLIDLEDLQPPITKILMQQDKA